MPELTLNPCSPLSLETQNPKCQNHLVSYLQVEGEADVCTVVPKEGAELTWPRDGLRSSLGPLFLESAIPLLGLRV